MPNRQGAEEHCPCWRQDADGTGTLEACRYDVATAILAAGHSGFQPRVTIIQIQCSTEPA